MSHSQIKEREEEFSKLGIQLIYQSYLFDGMFDIQTIRLYQMNNTLTNESQLVAVKQTSFEAINKQIPGASQVETEFDKFNSTQHSLRQIKHPNVQRYYHSFLANRTWNMVVEYCPNGNLIDFLSK